MENKIKLQLARLPKALGELAHSNQFLKTSTLAAYGFWFVTIFVLAYELTKPPVVLTLTPAATLLEVAPPPRPEKEIAEAVKAYTNLRYRWEPRTVSQNLQSAEAFIPPQSKKAYEAATAAVAKFATEKGVSQRIYVNDTTVNLEKKTIVVTGDRVTAIQGLKAAGDLKLELSFESGPRTRENPWGVYVTREKEE
jgi:hypothetical protein